MAALSFLGLVFPVLLIGLVVAGILAFNNGRREADPGGRRPYVITSC